ESPNQVADLHDCLATVPLQWAVERQWAGRIPLGRGLLQQNHKSVFKPCPYEGNRNTSEMASLWQVAVTLRVLRPDEPHATALWHRVNYARVVEQARLQPASRLPSAGLGQERAASRQLSDIRRSTLRQHLALVQDNYVLAAFGFVQIRGAEQHGEALRLHQVQNDLPQLPPRQWVNPNRWLIEQ